MGSVCILRVCKAFRGEARERAAVGALFTPRALRISWGGDFWLCGPPSEGKAAAHPLSQGAVANVD